MTNWDRLNSKRALVSTYHVPQPDRDSGARRIYDFIRFLVEAGWSVTFYAADGVGDERDAMLLRRNGVPVYDHNQIEFSKLLAACDFDLAVLAFWVNAERLLPEIRQASPRTRVIVDSVDVHFVREARRVFQGMAASGFSGGLRDQHADRMVREINAYAAADGVLTVSEKESQLINDLTGDPGLAQTAPDGESLEQSPIPFDQRKGILFVGSFQHHPNIGAVEYLCKEILPLLDPCLLAEHPVSIVGNALDDKVRGFGINLPYVRMVGWVPAVEPFLASTRISVVPLQYGAGTKRKLVQALMAGTPTVSTAIGIEGLNLRHGEHVLVADDASGFAAAMTRLLTDRELWQRLAEAGRNHLADTHHIEGARQRFLNAVDLVCGKSVKRYRPVPAANETAKVNAAVAKSQPSSKQRMTQALYLSLVGKVRDAIKEVITPGATVLIISKGDPELLKIADRIGWHFPRLEDGRYAGHYPADGAVAVSHLEALRREGADYLVIPSTAYWWLDYYPEFRNHLECRYSEARADLQLCRIFSLTRPAQSRHELNQANRANGTSGRPKDTRLITSIAEQKPSAAVAVADEATPPSGCQNLQHKVTSDEAARLIAFYLPQFHPIPENDRWWGEGFTEWRNVAKADPLFPGHYQPHIPADLGFYDLRCEETREQQAQLAREYGIHGFCYYHYWFEGKRLLERPFNEVLESGRPDFPFCLCWANDPWSRRWDGLTQDLLQAQSYSAADDLEHIRWLLPALSDTRAIKADGRPLFLVYRPKELPDARRTIDTWQKEVRRAGLKGLFLVAVQTAWDLQWDGQRERYDTWDPTELGFDAAVLFQPQFGKLLNSDRRIAVQGKESLQVYPYSDAWQFLADCEQVSYTRFDTVCPSWDNTARRGSEAVVLHGSTPAEYRKWLERAISNATHLPRDRRLVFVNAWNEWAEGCHLEPDLRDGRAYLEATRAALNSQAKIAFRSGKKTLSRPALT